MMKTSNTRAQLLGIFAAAGMLAGCGGSQSALTPSAGMNAHVTPQGQQGHRVLAYVGGFDTAGELKEFHFPKGQPLDHPISVSASGMCSRTDRGDFWVTESGGAEEFRAGGTKVLKTLTVTAGGDPSGCSIDKSSGDLAVALLNGGVVIFKDASGSGTAIKDGLSESFFIGYDDRGDLFADGFTSRAAVGFVELPAGSSTFHSVTLPNTIEFPGDVQWDGTYITVQDQEANAIYRYTISGSSATLEGTVQFSEASDCAGGDIFRGKYFLCPDAGDNNVKVYAYPAGGSPIDTWKGPTEPLGGIVIEQ
jgi:hypothetical protein